MRKAMSEETNGDGKEIRFFVYICRSCPYGAVALSVDVQTEKARASEGAVRYEAEAESVETIDCVKEYASTASGGENGYNSVGKVDYNTSRVNFSVDIAEEGDYVLRLAYCARNANATTILTTEEGLVYSVACTMFPPPGTGLARTRSRKRKSVCGRGSKFSPFAKGQIMSFSIT